MADAAQGQIRVKLQSVYTRIIAAMHKREYEEALPIFYEALRAYDSYLEGPKPNQGSIEFNEIEHRFSTILILVSSSLSSQVSTRRDISIDYRAGPHLLTSETEAGDVTSALAFAHQSLGRRGVSDLQRFYGHCCRAIAYSNMGDFMTELHTVKPESEHATILANANAVASWADADRSYKNAAQDAFYAAHLAGRVSADVRQSLVDKMRALRTAMCAKLGVDADEHLVQMHRAGLVRVQLPVLGLWEGDPALFEYWGPTNMAMMALFRQRDGPTGPNGIDLVEDFAQHGIHWTHDERGQVIVEARMHPTWVVPDDTRAGLRAAGLTMDTFEMARR